MIAFYFQLPLLDCHTKGNRERDTEQGTAVSATHRWEVARKRAVLERRQRVTDTQTLCAHVSQGWDGERGNVKSLEFLESNATMKE